MLISFIIPYHNEPLELLVECLHSVKSLCLDTDEYEVIVADGEEPRECKIIRSWELEKLVQHINR